MVLTLLIFNYFNLFSLFFDNRFESSGVVFANVILAIPVLFLRRFLGLYLAVWSVILSIPLFAHVFHYLKFGIAPAEYSYISVIETNNKEVFEFISTYVGLRELLIWISLLIIPAILTVLVSKINKYHFNLKLKFGIGLILLILNLINMSYEKNLFFQQYLKYEETKKELAKLHYWNKIVNQREDQVKIINQDSTENQTHIMIIGESLSKVHMSLYGYPRKTNPELEKIRDELFIFNDVMSPHCYTTGSIIKSLTLRDHEHEKKAMVETTLMDVLKKAGYKTYWITNQPILGNHENVISAIANLCDSVIPVNQSNLYPDEYFYDELVLDKVNEILKKNNGRKYIFVHLMGSHVDYTLRFPEHFKKFADDDANGIEMKEFIGKYELRKLNEYDNTVYYNDYVVSEILKKVKSKNDYSSLLYFSDHGDEVVDEIKFIGHNEGKPTKNMFTIPFVAWVSEKYRSENLEKVNNFNRFLDRKYQTDDLIYSALDLINLKPNFYDSTQSIFDSNFVMEPRINHLNNEYYNLDSL